MRFNLFKLIYWACLLFGLLPAANGQAQETGHEELLATIEARLGQPGGDTARFFILEEVRAHCGGDYGCLQTNYGRVLTKLEAGFQHFAGVLVAGEMANLARQAGDIDARAIAVGRLSAIYGLMGKRKM